MSITDAAGRATLWRMKPYALTEINSEAHLSRDKFPSQTVRIHPRNGS